jgi:hypothetical protein
MLARSQRLRSLKAGPLQVEQVVRENRLAIQQVQRPSVKTPSLDRGSRREFKTLIGSHRLRKRQLTNLSVNPRITK